MRVDVEGCAESCYRLVIAGVCGVSSRRGPLELAARVCATCHILQLLFHVECSCAACSVTAWCAADVTVRNGSGRLLRPVRACNAGRPWLVPGFCAKTRHGHDRSGQ